ncbi:ACYL-COA THIOESTER HYDROLASE YBHC-RELATED [Salix viminalis]|uniref:pectinesterase n=1 Tax=Salix viminalis TaxID=40686 RepID=A0A9Q0NZB4_SALVM|nr:ACYL-COA THIOESTER HYDROLASE YBHC-RELATED [Salix viminalis]
MPETFNGFLVHEEDYLKWLEHMGSFKHSLFQKAKNKFKPCLTMKVSSKPRSGEFPTLQKAINSLPVINNCRVVISISAGTYREKVEIPATMAYITLQGAGADKTIIEWGDTADRVENGRQLGTFGSATFAVNSPYFIAKDITFKNKAPLPPSGALGKQAVALRISADTAAFISCKFIGAQDTLFGALTAQKRQSFLEETGFSFVNCRITGSGALYLGRAWGNFSRVVFAYTYMDKIITPRGWYDWGDKSREMTVFFGQYKCSGPGADFGGRVAWSRELTEQQARPFISIGFIDGHEWLLNS